MSPTVFFTRWARPRHRLPARWLAAALLGISTLASPGATPPVAAQSVAPQGDDGHDLPLGFITANRGLVRAQLELSVTYAEQALSVLEHGAEIEQLTSASELSSKAYRLMRFAIEGLDLLMNNGRAPRNFKDPLLEMTRSMVERARHLNIHARLAMEFGVPVESRGGYVEDAIRGLQESIPLAQQAVELL
jgi:hypothetical protein